ncbi:MAG: DUF362 domain-containing protein [Deltaproteobacteria bacterium]|nr:DUF362 domain-containing protein [Deltaproteobacteria bacterium]MBW2086090.1 DUF362 domain-containing protein [Deltaproteobacteria bacterium]
MKGILKGTSVESSIGRHELDSTGSAVGVVRMDVEKSYTGVGELLQKYINDADQTAWEEIKSRIDYTYENIDLALTLLDTETGFSREIRSRLEKGLKLLFKPNLVSISNIVPYIHGPGLGSNACTEWSFVAAVMRWFHDKLGISYHQMCLGEAATTMSGAAALYTILKADNEPVTTEATIEGRSGDFYGGWGFYFVRRYLSEHLDRAAEDDPMKGFEESVAGTYIPPGHVIDKLMVYDLNRISDDVTKGRDVEVSDGVNFKSIILHKVVVGGDPNDPEDMKAYPGCILINLPKLKVHIQALFTNVIKNLGIGLYPMQAARTDSCQWEYAQPYTPVPGMKAGLPHQVWVPEMDYETCLPKRDADGNYIVKKTGGLTATMIDIIKAVADQNIFMVNIVDALEPTNVDHTGSGLGLRQPEGLIFAGLDPVATDYLCARYIFSNVRLKEAHESGLDDGSGGRFPQAVPIAVVEGSNIVTRPGLDCPLARDICFKVAEERGLGTRTYYVVGHDSMTDTPLASLQGRLGRVENRTFSSIITTALYTAAFKIPWDMQRTFFGYLEAVDQLAGSSLKKEFLDAFDEDGDGIVTYEEKGKKGIYGPGMLLGGINVSMMGAGELEQVRVNYAAMANHLKYTYPEWNREGLDLFKEYYSGTVAMMAYMMSLSDVETQDNFISGLTWGKGKWPSFQQAAQARISQAIYGLGFPSRIGFPSLYYTVFRYADLTQNGRRYIGPQRLSPDEEAAAKYIKEVLSGQAEPLDFTLYVPPGYARMDEFDTPNVEETSDPARILTAVFNGGKIVWPDLKITDVQTDITP